MSIFSRIFGKGEGEGEGDPSGGDGGAGIRCPNCGTRSAPDAAFCGECGTTLREAGKPPQPRRTTATEKSGPQSARPQLAPQTANTIHQPPQRDPRAAAPVVASRGQPQRKKSNRPPAVQGQQTQLPVPPAPRAPPAKANAGPKAQPQKAAAKAQQPAPAKQQPTRSPSQENLDRMLEEF